MVAAVLSAIDGILSILRIQFIDPSFGGIPFVLLGLTIAILALRSTPGWVFGPMIFVVLVPEVFRFLSLPSSIVGYSRVLLYSLLLIVLVRTLSTRYTPEKRFV